MCIKRFLHIKEDDDLKLGKEILINQLKNRILGIQKET